MKRHFFDDQNRNINIERSSREMYLDSLERDDNKGQRFESLDEEDLNQEKEFKILRREESLRTNRMHIIEKPYVKAI